MPRHRPAAVAAVALGVSCVAGLLVGLAPALHGGPAGARRIAERRRRRATGAPSQQRLRRTLVTAEIRAVDAALLVTAGLLVQTVVRLGTCRARISRRTTCTSSIRVETGAAHRRHPVIAAFYEALLRRIRDTPGRRGGRRGDWRAARRERTLSSSTTRRSRSTANRDRRRIRPTARIQVVERRLLRCPRDSRSSRARRIRPTVTGATTVPVAIVNRAFRAQRYFPNGATAVGRTIAPSVVDCSGRADAARDRRQSPATVAGKFQPRRAVRAASVRPARTDGRGRRWRSWSRTSLPVGEEDRRGGARPPSASLDPALAGCRFPPDRN